jgi:lysophospholipase L1-like esterase
MLKYIFRFFIALIFLAGITEIILRVKFGFCNAPLYVTDPDFEYVFAPNQHINRFGNIIRTNELSMRSDPVLSSDSLVILLIGDSVINGGSLTDHDSLASTKLEKRLSSTLKRRVRVLNIAAGSWGPDNGAAYLKKYGTFGADLMCLVTSSHDAHDNITHINLIGVDPGMPDKQYKVALVELWERYRGIALYKLNAFIFPDPAPVVQAPLDSIDRAKLINGGIRKPGEGFNQGYQQLADMAKKDSIPFFIYLHPEITEVSLGSFNDQGQEIMGFANKNQIRLVNEFDLGISLLYYRDTDTVHYNDKGQQFLAQNLYPLFLEYLNKKK